METKEKTNTTENTEATKVTAEQIAQWKQKHGKVHCYTTADKKEAYFSTPSRRIIGAATVLAGSDHLKQKEIILTKCFLGGDAEVMNEDKYFYGLGDTVDSMIETITGELKEV